VTADVMTGTIRRSRVVVYVGAEIIVACNCLFSLSRSLSLLLLGVVLSAIPQHGQDTHQT